MHRISATSWDDLWGLILALWPRWEPNDEQQALWRARLSPRSTALVRQVVQEAAAEERGITPRLAWITDRLKNHAIGRIVRPQIDESPEWAAIDRDLGAMRGDLERLPAGYRTELLIKALGASCVAFGARIGDSTVRDSDQITLRTQAERMGDEVAEWSSPLVGLAWAAHQAGARA